MGDMTEDRVYDADAGTTEVVVAAGVGVMSVSVSAGRIGRFGVARRCSPRDVAAGDGRLAVATAEDVLLRHEGAFEPAGFGPAVAVGIRKSVLAADDRGGIARLDRETGDWTVLGRVDAGVRAIDGPLLATDSGVYRVVGDGDDAAVEPAGLETANDVAARGPLAATDAGLYALGNGWMRALEGRFGAVAAASRERAYAVGESFYRRHGGHWGAVDLPVDDPVVDAAVADRAYAITEGGTLLAGPEWRFRSLGVAGIAGIAAV
jgi:hypothetical protein